MTGTWRALGSPCRGSRASQGRSLPALWCGYLGNDNHAYKCMPYSSGHVTDGHCPQSYGLWGYKAAPATAIPHFRSSLLCYTTQELCDMENWHFWVKLEHKYFYQLLRVMPSPYNSYHSSFCVWVSSRPLHPGEQVRGLLPSMLWFLLEMPHQPRQWSCSPAVLLERLSSFPTELRKRWRWPAQHQKTHSLACCFLLPQIDPLQDNWQGWPWSPQLNNLSENGGVGNPRVWCSLLKAVSASHRCMVAVPTSSRFQICPLFFDKQVSSFQKRQIKFCARFLSEMRRTDTLPCTCIHSSGFIPGAKQAELKWQHQRENTPEWLLRSAYFDCADYLCCLS